MTPLRVLSLGAGVQSTTLLMLILNGEVEADAAVFADTGWEPRQVYDHLEQLQALAAMKGFPVYVVQSGDIRDTQRQKAFYDAPYFLKTSVTCDRCEGTGKTKDHFICSRCGGAGRYEKDGMARRQCTHQLKLLPIRRKVRELLVERGVRGTPAGAVTQLIGISWDEVQRMRDSDVKFVDNEYPLIDRRWTRADCKRYLQEQGIDAPRSACIGCPYHSNAEWREMKIHRPEEFADAVLFEQEIQASEAGLRGTPFLHAARVPLDEVDFSTLEDRGQGTLFDAECLGMCGS